MQYLALPSNCWNTRYEPVNIKLDEGFVAFERFKEICLGLDLKFEILCSRIVFQSGRLWNHICVWNILAAGFIWWGGGIISLNSTKLLLRCHPCPDLYKILETKVREEKIGERNGPPSISFRELLVH